MATQRVGLEGRRGVDWRRAEFVLMLPGFLGFVTVAIRITTVYDGLPAHPLIIHVPVVLIPVSILGALACVARPAWFGRYGILLCCTAIVAMSSIFLAMQDRRRAAKRAAPPRSSGAPDQRALTRGAYPRARIRRVHRDPDPHLLGDPNLRRHGTHGLKPVDRAPSARPTLIGLQVALIVLALASAFWVFRVGDLGAKAVWQGRI